MKKFFLFAAAALAAMTINAEQITFSVDKPAGDGVVYADGGFKLSLVDTDGKMAVDANNCYFGDAKEQVKFEARLKTGGKSAGKNNLTLTIPTAGTLYLYPRTGSNSATDRNVTLTQNDNIIFDEVMLESNAIEVPGLDSKEPEKMTKVYPVYSVAVSAGEVKIGYTAGSINFYGFSLGAPIAPEEGQGIDELLVAPKTNKVVYKGQVVIVKEGRMFNLLGAEVLK